MQTVFVKLLHRSGATSATEVDVPARIVRIEDADAQYRALAEYINCKKRQRRKALSLFVKKFLEFLQKPLDTSPIGWYTKHVNKRGEHLRNTED